MAISERDQKSDRVVTLSWPAEMARRPEDSRGELLQPGSNIVLDLHGDPLRSDLVIYSDGNHHMALEETVRAFLERQSGLDDILYATTPPRILLEAIEVGAIRSGNLQLSVMPDVFIGPPEAVETLRASGRVASHERFMQSRGVALLARKGNPKGIGGIQDILNSDIRLALSNPVSEKASYMLYEAAILGNCAGDTRSEAEITDYLRGDDVVKSTVIHHREIPEILAADRADVSLVYRHLALRYERIFPDVFELIPLKDADTAEPDRQGVASYHVGVVGDGGRFGGAFRDFLFTDEVTAIYEHHGLSRPSA